MIVAYTKSHKARSLNSEDENSEGHTHHQHEGHEDPLEGLDKAIGVSLVLGFIFMLLIDQISSGKQKTII